MNRLQEMMRCGRTDQSLFSQRSVLNDIGDISGIYYIFEKFNIKQKQGTDVSGLQFTLGRLYEGGFKK